MEKRKLKSDNNDVNDDGCALTAVAETQVAASNTGTAAAVTAENQVATSYSSSSSAAVEDKIRLIYSKHNPTKLDELSELLLKYKGKEQELLLRMRRKYLTSGALLESKYSGQTEEYLVTDKSIRLVYDGNFIEGKRSSVGREFIYNDDGVTVSRIIKHPIEYVDPCLLKFINNPSKQSVDVTISSEKEKKLNKKVSKQPPLKKVRPNKSIDEVLAEINHEVKALMAQKDHYRYDLFDEDDSDDTTIQQLISLRYEFLDNLKQKRSQSPKKEFNAEARKKDEKMMWKKEDVARRDALIKYFLNYYQFREWGDDVVVQVLTAKELEESADPLNAPYQRLFVTKEQTSARTCRLCLSKYNSVLDTICACKNWCCSNCRYVTTDHPRGRDPETYGCLLCAMVCVNCNFDFCLKGRLVCNDCTSFSCFFEDRGSDLRNKFLKK